MSAPIFGFEPRRRPAAGKAGRLFCSQPFTRFEVLGGGGE